MSKTIIVSNRLPIQVSKIEGSIEIKPSVGGLVTGMKSVHTDGNGVWVGWTGIPEEELNKSLAKKVNKDLEKAKCISVPLNSKDIKKYYEGFSNRAIWPLFHYFMEYTRFEHEEWKAYKRVNKKFAKVVLDHVEEGDTVWVHDYQLLLLPELIKEQKPNISVGLFLHIPFPSYEIFRTFPYREEMLKGMLGADLIGFHTYDYERHFVSCIKRILRLEVQFNQITYQDRIIKLDSFPMGIDYDKYHYSAIKHNSPNYKKSAIHDKLVDTIKKDKKLILSIDRMDYTKGIPKRLRAFEYFLEKYPEYIEKVILVMLAVPSRSNVPQYKKLKRETDELVGRINGKFGRINWTPVWYFYRSLPFDDLIDLYISSDVALITPIRDGMNLVAKEYIATRVYEDGVLVLSEMAGASNEMNEALLINPNSFEDVANNLKKALEMPLEEQRSRVRNLQKRLKRYNVEKWAREFLVALETTKHVKKELIAKKLNGAYEKKLVNDFHKNKNRLLLLDYDGTLVGFKDNPQDAKPDKALYKLLDSLQAQENTTLVLISGRDKETFEKWFGDKPYNLVTDHGVWLRENEKWISLERLKTEWMESIRPILETFVDRTPGTFIETKNYSLAWHYRMADPELANIRKTELDTVVTSMVDNNDLSVLKGKKVIEIKNSNVNKGRALNRLLTDNNYDFITVIGDDWTDEYMFEEAPESAYTIKVGFTKTKAKYQVKDSKQVLQLLKKFV